MACAQGVGRGRVAARKTTQGIETLAPLTCGAQEGRSHCETCVFAVTGDADGLEILPDPPFGVDAQELRVGDLRTAIALRPTVVGSIAGSAVSGSSPTCGNFANTNRARATARLR